MSKSLWDKFQVEKKIIEILKDAKIYGPKPHWGLPFMTCYQISIEFQERHQKEFYEIRKRPGGKGNGSHDSFSRYIAKELSTKYKKHRDKYPIEMAFVANNNFEKLSFSCKGRSISSSQRQFSIFRLNKNVIK